MSWGLKVYFVTWRDGNSEPICAGCLAKEPEDAVAGLREPETYQGCLRCLTARSDASEAFHAIEEDWFDKNFSGPACLDCGNEMPKGDKGNICLLCHYARYDENLMGD